MIWKFARKIQPSALHPSYIHLTHTIHPSASNCTDLFSDATQRPGSGHGVTKSQQMNIWVSLFQLNRVDPMSNQCRNWLINSVRFVRYVTEFLYSKMYAHITSQPIIWCFKANSHFTCTWCTTCPGRVWFLWVQSKWWMGALVRLGWPLPALLAL